MKRCRLLRPKITQLSSFTGARSRVRIEWAQSAIERSTLGGRWPSCVVVVIVERTTGLVPVTGSSTLVLVLVDVALHFGERALASIAGTECLEGKPRVGV